MFGNDPCDPFGFNARRHMQQMDRMMDQLMGNPFGMMDSFGMMDPFFGGAPRVNPAITNESSSSLNPRRRTYDASNAGMGMLSAFGGMGMFPNIGNMMSRMENDPNSMVFSSSTMISYDGNGEPRVVQNSVRKAGDVKETRRSVRDGNVEEVVVGHAIGDREHVIEKKRGSDGRIRKNQRFINLDESDAEIFNTEFRTRSRNPFASKPHHSGHRAIQNDGNHGFNRVSSSQAVSSVNSGGSSAPIIEIPDDDFEEPRHRARDQIRYGPIISEVNDDDEVPVTNNTKRRRDF